METRLSLLFRLRPEVPAGQGAASAAIGKMCKTPGNIGEYGNKLCKVTVDFSESRRKIRAEIEIVPNGAIAKSELRIRPEAGKSLNGRRPEWLLPFFSPFKASNG